MKTNRLNNIELEITVPCSFPVHICDEKSWVTFFSHTQTIVDKGEIS